MSAANLLSSARIHAILFFFGAAGEAQRVFFKREVNLPLECTFFSFEKKVEKNRRILSRISYSQKKPPRLDRPAAVG